jgi:CRISPR-associated endonuclease/helicase Cas3
VEVGDLGSIPADVEDEEATRLGAHDLLVDLPEPLASPFGGVVTRIAIPHHMARGIGARDEPHLIDARSFQLSSRRFGYDQWGLHALA